MGSNLQNNQSSGNDNTPPRRPVEPPNYVPPTVDQLAILRKGGGGETIEKK